MRFPVFARRTNPSIDKPILRKKMKYLEDQVASGVADWVDSREPRRGIIAREMLHFGDRALPVATVEISTDYQWRLDGELRGVRFVSPTTTSKPSVAAIREGWDWSKESALLTA